MPVLDTNVVIRHSHGDPAAGRAIDRARADGQLLLPAVAAVEFLCGVEDVVASLHMLHEAFSVVHSDDSQVLQSARLGRRGQTRLGMRLSDIQIAAVAVLNGTYVVTTNKRHFTQLGVPAWHFIDETAPPAGK